MNILIICQVTVVFSEEIKIERVNTPARKPVNIKYTVGLEEVYCRIKIRTIKPIKKMRSKHLCTCRVVPIDKAKSGSAFVLHSTTDFEDLLVAYITYRSNIAPILVISAYLIDIRPIAYRIQEVAVTRNHIIERRVGPNLEYISFNIEIILVP